VTDWHTYQIDWHADRVMYRVDGETIYATQASPRGPLALVIWIDNQYAALSPDGKMAVGALATAQPAWIEIADLALEAQ